MPALTIQTIIQRESKLSLIAIKTDLPIKPNATNTEVLEKTNIAKVYAQLIAGLNLGMLNDDYSLKENIFIDIRDTDSIVCITNETKITTDDFEPSFSIQTITKEQAEEKNITCTHYIS